MLTQDSINATCGTAQVLAERGVHLGVAQNTPLSMMVQISLRSAAIVQQTTGLTDPVPAFEELLMSAANNGDAVQHNDHDEIVSNAVAAVGQAINFNNRLAKDVVNPMVERVSATVAKALEVNLQQRSVPVEIQPVFDNAFWNLPYTRELFDRYGDTPAANVSYSGPAIPFDANVLTTGVDGFDTSIQEFVTSTQDSTVSQPAEHYWNATFGAGRFDTQDILKGGRDAINAGIVMYLGANRLSGNPPEGSNYSAIEWETVCNNIKAQAGRVVARGLQKLERERRLNQMVIESPQAPVVGSKIYVDGQVYNQFLNEGGTPEAILGGYFHGRVGDYQQLLTERDAFAGKWKAAQAVLVSQAVGDSMTALIGALSSAVTTEINQIPEEELHVDRAALHARLRDQLKFVSSRDIDNLWYVCRKVICRTIYPHTDAESTLEAIDEQMRMQPDLSVREAALYATIDQLAKWLARLITVEGVTIR